MDELNPEIGAQVAVEIRPDERLIWAGQPTMKNARRSAWPICLSGIPVLAFALFWVTMAGSMIWFGPAGNAAGIPGKVLNLFPLFGLPVVIFGLAMVSAPYWAMRRAKKSWYALTNQRTIVSLANWFNSGDVTSYPSQALTKMSRRNYSDGSGDLIFEELPMGLKQLMMSGMIGGFRHFQQTDRRGFLGIADVRHVEELVRQTLVHGAKQLSQ